MGNAGRGTCRVEIAGNRHIAGAYPVRHARDSAWGEDHSQADSGRHASAFTGPPLLLAGDGLTYA